MYKTTTSALDGIKNEAQTSSLSGLSSWSSGSGRVNGGVTATGCCSNKVTKIDIRLLTPMRYPSSWFPTFHLELWSIDISSGRSTVLAKSINHTLALNLSWTNSNELPMTCKIRQYFSSRNVVFHFQILPKHKPFSRLISVISPLNIYILC